MRILFTILFLCFGALLWAAFAIARSVRASRRSSTPTRASETGTILRSPRQF